MSQKLFTRLIEQITCSLSQNVAETVIEQILEASQIVIRDKQLQQAKIYSLTTQVMNKQIHSVGQAFMSNPFQPRLQQDRIVSKHFYESNRPLSAKITFIPKKITKCRGSRRSLYRSSHKNSIKSTKSLANFEGSHHKNNRFSKEAEVYYPLPIEREIDDQQQYVNKLRIKKMQQYAYQKQKQNFFKAMADEEQQYSKINKRFIQLMGSKPYYYNKNGQPIETSNPAAPKLLKKTVKNTISYKTENTTRQVSDKGKGETVTVSFKQRENGFKKSGDSFILSSVKPLFYKSDNCKYKIIS